jgi:hypothetical protein
MLAFEQNPISKSPGVDREKIGFRSQSGLVFLGLKNVTLEIGKNAIVTSDPGILLP